MKSMEDTEDMKDTGETKAAEETRDTIPAKGIRKHKRLLVTLAVALGLILLSVFAFVLYAEEYYHASDAAVALSVTDGAGYTIADIDGDIAFIPDEPKAGIVFYPGGKVEHTAYAPLMAEFARNGILCVLVQVPFRLAVLDVGAAAGIPEHFPEIDEWYIGGHSLGGAMAASYVSKHADAFSGLLLLGAFSTVKLPDEGLTVISVYGSKDGVLDAGKYKTYRENLPEGCTEYVIDGGCHSYFGDYGMQKGDGTPTVTREEQMRKTAEVFISAIEGESAR